MTGVERAELADLREEMNGHFAQLREDLSRGFRDASKRESETRDRVARIEGGIGMVKWLGPGGIAALIVGLLLQSGVIHLG